MSTQRLQSQLTAWRRTGSVACVMFWICIVEAACARLPYTTQVVHQDRRVDVSLQREITPSGYSHPVEVRPDQIAAILSPFSFREKQRLPLRWFAEETPPRQMFRSDELGAIATYLAQALQKAGPEERVYFKLLAPGNNPAAERDTTAGWIAVREPYFLLTLEHFHAQFPIQKDEQWDLRYPALPPKAGTYLLYFEPGRFWVVDPVSGQHAVLFREFLKYVPGPAGK